MRIPENYQEFTKEIAQLCVKYSLRNFRADFSPSVNDHDWNGQMHISWNSGRHGAEITNVRLSADVLESINIEANVRKFYNFDKE